jgi:hypothetical protein
LIFVEERGEERRGEERIFVEERRVPSICRERRRLAAM